MALPFLPPSDFEGGPAESGVSSEMVFHSPQDSQRPDHLEKDAPHAEQEKILEDLAMPFDAPSPSSQQAPSVAKRCGCAAFVFLIEYLRPERSGNLQSLQF